MPQHAHTETVSASPAAIFAIIDDLSRTPQWLKRCTRLDNLSGGPTTVGDLLKYSYKEGRRMGVMDGSVVERVPDRRLTNRFVDSMMDVTVDFGLQPGATADQTVLTHTITITTKGFGRIFAPLIARQLPGQTVGAMSELKKLAESERQS